MSEEYKPLILNKRQILYFFLKTLITGLNNPLIREAYSIKSLTESLRLRKQLLLSKLIKFNGRYYSTLSLPGFPSKAYDNMVRNGGMNFSKAGTSLKRQIDTVLLAVTSRCSLECTHCYERQNINKNSPVSPEKWIKTVADLQMMGTNIIILTGGEPLLAFGTVLKILESGDKALSDFHIHTSGHSVTRDKVRLLKKAGLTAAGVGLDDYIPERHNKIRGHGAFGEAVKALRLFNEEGILTYVNFCVNAEVLKGDELYRYLDFVKSLNVSLVELLEPRPCGGLVNEPAEVLISSEDKKKLLSFTTRANTLKEYKDHPLVYYLAHIEGKDQMGCMMGGLSHFYIDSFGNVNPCVFMPVSFGNIMQEDFNKIFRRMRNAVPSPVHSDCPSILMSDAVKEHISGGLPVSFNEISNEWYKTLIF
jgi:MoaA/NifB/PqqE/SkfB family radical SAM enzyme